MKILFFYTHNQSFLAAFFNELALTLQERGWQVQVFSFKKEASILKSPFRVDIKRKQNYFKNGIEIFKAIRDFKPDVVVSNFSYVNAAVLSARYFGVKRNIVWAHTLSDQLSASKLQIFRKSIFLKMASKIIVNSNELKKDLVDNFAIKPDMIFPTPFWSSLENESIKKKDLDFGNIKIGIPGRIEEVKNQEIIVNLLLEYRGLRNIKWVFAGSGSQDDRLKERVHRNGLETSIEFLGILEIERMKRFYKEMDIILLPSKFESFGLVLIEALSMDCPVIVSEKFGALNYIMDENFIKRYTFDPHNVESLKIKIDQFLASPSEPTRYFRNVYLKFFQKQEIINSVEKIFK